MKELLKRANREKPCSYVLKNAKYLNVFTSKWETGDIGIYNDTIIGVGEYNGDIEIDYSGKYIVPSFIDSHVHIESSLGTPAIFCKEILPFGTTTVVADPHEIANVSGSEGLEYVFEATQKLPINAYVVLPSCVPASKFETSGANLRAKELLKFKDEPNCLGLGEVMDNVYFKTYDEDKLEKLNAFKGGNIDGHAILMSRQDLNAYKLTGIKNDHENFTEEDVLNKVSLGFQVLAREGSSTKNVAMAINTILKYNLPCYNFAFCTDDKHVDDIRVSGHISNCIKIAISLGLDPIEAYKIASFYPAKSFNIPMGAIAPGYKADLVVLNDVNSVNVKDVFSKGQKVVEDKKVIVPIEETEANKKLKNSVCPINVDNKKLEIKFTKKTATVIDLMVSLLTKKLEYTPENEVFNYENGFRKVVVCGRHSTNVGNLTAGILNGYNIDGAIASTVSHDSHNIVAIGNNDDDIVCAINEIQRMQGGYVLVKDKKIISRVYLPICGLISDANPIELHNQLEDLTSKARKLGISNDFDVLQPLSFLGLSVIPELRITDLGIVDVFKGEFIKY